MVDTRRLSVMVKSLLLKTLMVKRVYIYIKRVYIYILTTDWPEKAGASAAAAAAAAPALDCHGQITDGHNANSRRKFSSSSSSSSYTSSSSSSSSSRPRRSNRSSALRSPLYPYSSCL